MVLAFFLLRPIPLPYSDDLRALEVAHDEDDDFSAASPALLGTHNNSQTHLLHGNDDDSDEDLLEPIEYHHEVSPSDYVVPGAANSLALSPARHSFGSRHRSRSSMASARRPLGSSGQRLADGQPNIRGTALASSGNFWILFAMTSLRECDLCWLFTC